MTNILDRVARTYRPAQTRKFLPESPSEFLALRIASEFGDGGAVRHYLELSARYGDDRLLTAFRRVRHRGSRNDVGRLFTEELKRLFDSDGDDREITSRRLAAIRIDRRAIAVATLSGAHLDSMPMVRQLSSDGEKALDSAVAFVTRLLERRPFTVAAMEILPDREEAQRTLLDQAITGTLSDYSQPVSIWRVAKQEVLSTYGFPAPRFRNQVREVMERIFPGTNGTFGGHLIKDALALGLYCQIEHLLNL